jgi:hypothetical protein
VRRRGPVEAYAEHLKKEIDSLGAVIGGRHAVHLHWAAARRLCSGPIASLRSLTGSARHST